MLRLGILSSMPVPVPEEEEEAATEEKPWAEVLKPCGRGTPKAELQEPTIHLT